MINTDRAFTLKYLPTDPSLPLPCGLNRQTGLRARYCAWLSSQPLMEREGETLAIHSGQVASMFVLSMADYSDNSTGMFGIRAAWVAAAATRGSRPADSRPADSRPAGTRPAGWWAGSVSQLTPSQQWD